MNSQSQLQSNAALFAELHSRLNLLQKDVEGKAVLSQADAEVAKLDADSLNDVITNVHNRWLSSIDKVEPEIADEFLRQMKDAIYAIHATEGFPNVKVKGARDGGPDWLVKIVQGNTAMQAAIDQGPGPENRVAVADS
mgnify:FL=1